MTTKTSQFVGWTEKELSSVRSIKTLPVFETHGTYYPKKDGLGGITEATLPNKFATHGLIPPGKTLGELSSVEQDPNGLPLNTPGAKADAGKILPWLFVSGFANALEEVAKVTTKGAQKYTPNGWATVPNGEERYMEAFGRHLLELAKGNKMDDGPKGLGPDIYHKAEMIWNLLASLELEIRSKKA